MRPLKIYLSVSKEAPTDLVQKFTELLTKALQPGDQVFRWNGTEGSNKLKESDLLIVIPPRFDNYHDLRVMVGKGIYQEVGSATVPVWVWKYNAPIMNNPSAIRLGKFDAFDEDSRDEANWTDYIDMVVASGYSNLTSVLDRVRDGQNIVRAVRPEPTSLPKIAHIGPGADAILANPHLLLLLTKR